MIARHALFGSGSSMSVCEGLFGSSTGEHLQRNQWYYVDVYVYTT